MTACQDFLRSSVAPQGEDRQHGPVSSATRGEWRWILMELIEGETLRAWMGRMRGREASRIAENLRKCQELCRLVEALHSVGILHRDLNRKTFCWTGGGSG
ncbi:protein of unknown function [Candidatus Hydrogenisulfobacillus filiaventi]|uniref:Protein kinase domain-containing protein n=1 Tax=Candidatus Hydrogenisulfobacillus filiaventi TaxID=2707344 RepID=A0A6F8ZE31_9FIRM|nr:protein of unknown function [Candidatus Hydrogenisulfobacillus filiaventi]